MDLKKQLISSLVHHKKFGDGKIVAINDNIIVVRFIAGEKQFSYPNAFENFLVSFDEELQGILIDLINNKKFEEEQKSKRALDQINKKIIYEKGKFKPDDLKRNIAFKCNYCDGGFENNNMGFYGICSDDMMKYNIIKVKHSMCCDSKCLDYLFGKINKSTLQEYYDNEKLCYECRLFQDWKFGAGFKYDKIEKRYIPKTLAAATEGYLAVLTSRSSYSSEEARKIVGVFFIDEVHKGDKEEPGYVASHSKYRMYLNYMEAREMPFWKYYKNVNNPEKIAWSYGLQRYLDNQQAADILKDLVEVKKGSKDEKIAKEMYEAYCMKHCVEIKDFR